MSGQNYQENSHEIEDIGGDFMINPAGLDEILGDGGNDLGLESDRNYFGSQSNEFNSRNILPETLNTQEPLKQGGKEVKKVYLKTRPSFKEDAQTDSQYQLNQGSLTRTNPTNEDTTQDKLYGFSKKNDSPANNSNNSGFDSDSKPLNKGSKEIREGSVSGDDYSSIHVVSRFKPEPEKKFSLTSAKLGHQGYERQLTEKSGVSYSIKDIESHVTDRELIDTIEKAGLQREPIFKSIEITARSDDSLVQLKNREMPDFAIPGQRKTELPPLKLKGVSDLKYNQKKVEGLISLKSGAGKATDQRNDIAIPFKNFSQTQKEEPQESVLPNFAKQTTDIQAKKKGKKKKKKTKKAKAAAQDEEDEEREREPARKKSKKIQPEEGKKREESSPPMKDKKKKKADKGKKAKEKQSPPVIIDLEAGPKNKTTKKKPVQKPKPEPPQNKITATIKPEENADANKPQIHDDMMLGLNVISYFKHKLIPTGNKIFYGFVLIFFVANFVTSLLQIILLGCTSCSDDHQKVFVYINFIILFFLKIGMFNFVTFEISGNLPLELKYPFIIPCLAFGIFPIMQLPQFIFDWQTCKSHSFFDLDFGFTMTNIMGIGSICAVGGFLCVSFMLSGCKIPTKGLKTVRNTLYFLGFCFLMALNVITLIMQFTQITSFVAGFFLEVFGFWFFLVAGFVIFLLRRCTRWEIFRTIQELEGEENDRDPQHQPKVRKGEMLQIVRKEDIQSEEALHINEIPREIEIVTTDKGNLTFGQKKTINLEEK